MVEPRAQLPFNPDVLEWARLRAGMSVEEAAKKTNVSPDRVAAWEAGDTTPTPRQARILAKHYDRPFLEFFAKEIPEVQDLQLVPDYRFHTKPAGPVEARTLRQTQAWAEEQRLNVLDLFDMLGEQPGTFPKELYSKTSDDVEDVARRVREHLDFSAKDQTSLSNSLKYKLPTIIRSKFSSCNVLILKDSALGKFRTRGICLFADPLPVIIYRNEAPGAQSFTLAHEFAHVLLQKSAISAFPRFGRTTNQSKLIEGWCNRFAAAFLMPEEEIQDEMPKPDEPDSEISDSRISEMAWKFGVSRQAMLIRFVTLKYVEPKYYWRVKRQQFIEEEENYEPPPARGPYYGTRYKSRLGEYYTGLVMEAWNAGAITAHNAAEFMGIKNLEHLIDIRREVSF